MVIFRLRNGELIPSSNMDITLNTTSLPASNTYKTKTFWELKYLKKVSMDVSHSDSFIPLDKNHIKYISMLFTCTKLHVTKL